MSILRYRVHAPLVMTLLFTSLAASVRADDVDSRAMGRAQAFLDGEKRGRDILGYVHFGSRYGGHEAKRARGVADASGRTVPGHFALVYTFTWDGDGWTDVAFLCDAKGSVYGVKPLGSNATFNQPFLKANLAIAILGNVLIEAFGDQMKEEDRRAARKFVNDADAKGLLELSLQVQQALGG